MSSETTSTNNNDDNTKEQKSSAVILFLSFAILVACLCKLTFTRFLKNKFPLPFTVAVLLIAFIIGLIVTKVGDSDDYFVYGVNTLSEMDPQLMYYIFLPLLIFDSAFRTGPGVFISTAIIAICAIYIFPYNWSWLIGLIFGSIVSATDTIAVIALLHDSGASEWLASLIDAESLLNDGSAYVMFLIFHSIILGGDRTAGEIIRHIAKYSIAGPAFGLVCGIISVIVLNCIHNELQVEITATFGLAYLVFYVADVELGVSAVLAIVVMGLYMSKYRYCISNSVQPSMASVWNITAFFINILVFTITGLILARSFFGVGSVITGKDFGYSIVLYIMIHIGRVLTVTVLFPLIRISGVHLTWQECVILVWSSLRGSMALILVMIVYLDTAVDLVTSDRFLFHVSMIVLLTLVINGTSSKYMVKLLGLHHGTKESKIVLLQALEHMRKQTQLKLAEMKQDQKFVDVDWKMLNKYLPDKLIEELDEENDRDLYRQLTPTQISNDPSPAMSRRCSYEPVCIDSEMQIVPTVYQSIADPFTLTMRKSSSKHGDIVLPIIDAEDLDNEHDRNIRNELIMRFLTALSVDYEKQWYLGMIRRHTMNILTKSIGEAKRRCSLQLHWKIIASHFRLTFFIRFLMKFKSFAFINRWINRLLFDRIFRTIELVLAFHSAKTRMKNICVQFPELASINEKIMDEVWQEVKIYQLNAMHILFDLQQSYRLCWITQMTRRSAKMLLKFEAISIIQLYETGMLEEKEYKHILELIEEKSISLEYGKIRTPQNEMKAIEDPWNFISYFQLLSFEEKNQWKLRFNSKHQWLQPGSILFENNQHVSTAYLIIRGIVQCQKENISTYFKCGSIVGIDALFTGGSFSYGTCSTKGCLVEVYLIDLNLLDRLLTDERISRLIYSELALHMLMHNHRNLIDYCDSRLKMLFDEKAYFYKNETDLIINLQVNDRLFLLSGTINQCLNDEEKCIQSNSFISYDYPTSYRLNPSSIVFTWTLRDEIHYSNVKMLKMNFSTDTNEIEAFYPLYLGGTTEFTTRRHSSSIARPVENIARFQLIPAEMDSISYQ